MCLTPIIHEAVEFDFSFEGRRNQCVQHITQCLENRFVFPAVDFEVSGIQIPVKHLTAMKGPCLPGKT